MDPWLIYIFKLLRRLRLVTSAAQGAVFKLINLTNCTRGAKEDRNKA